MRRAGEGKVVRDQPLHSTCYQIVHDIIRKSILCYPYLCVGESGTEVEREKRGVDEQGGSQGQRRDGACEWRSLESKVHYLTYKSEID